MGRSGHVLHTNVVLYHLAGKLAAPLPLRPLFISIVTEIELLSFKLLTDSERNQISAFLASVTVINLDGAIKDETIRLRLSVLRLPDAVVATTASVYDAELWTHDARLLKAPGIVALAPALKA